MSMSKLTAEEIHANRVKWLEALESGKFEQAQGTLSEPVLLPRKGGSKVEQTDFRYCCLGVWCKISKGWGMYDDLLGNKLNTDGREALGMTRDEMDRAVIMNDGEEGEYDEEEDDLPRSFEYIASWFRIQWNIPKV